MNNEQLPLWLRIYDRVTLRGPMPVIVLILTLAATAFFGFYAGNFKMDASSDSITLENDHDLRYYDDSRRTFGNDDYVFLVVRPEAPLFSPETLKGIASLRDELLKQKGVTSVTSVLNVPLFHSPDVTLMSLASGYNSLLKEGTDPKAAEAELMNSPLFNDYLVSKDGKTTVLQVNFESDDVLNKHMWDRYNLLNKKTDGTITPEETKALADADKAYRAQYVVYGEERDRRIAETRATMERHQSLGHLFLGGVPMIVSDMVSFIVRDFALFGALVLAFVVLMLWLIFRRVKLFVLPFLTCVVTLIIMMGWLGFRDWHTTVVTSNFTSLLLIITTENAIHVATQWREILGAHPEKTKREILLGAMGEIMSPCAYSLLTTMVGFASLIVSGIRPVMDFGIMMTFGLGVGFIVTFFSLPALMMLLPKEKPIKKDELASGSTSNVSFFAHLTENHPRLVLLVTLLLFAGGLAGISRLTVENKFINYFRKSSAIYKGMDLVDSSLGGTTPMDVVLIGDGKDYWTKPENLAKLRRIHEYLDELPETGKVVSLDTMMRVLEGITKKPMNQQTINLVKGRLPEDLAKDILKPYVTPDFSQTRIAMRVKDGYPNLKRKELLDKVKAELEKLGWPIDTSYDSKPGTAHVTGMFVLYNNMLQTLFTSQIATIGTVFIACFLTFALVFRSFSLALLGLAPNILSIVVILGMIGWIGVPLDMMTIMIAAITFGLADDNTIHYLHRFQEEFRKDRNYMATMYRCHNTIGRPLSYTAITIVVGFSILIFSSFTPTMWFGIFTGIAIALALVSSHTMLPMLVLFFKPLGPDSGQPAPETPAKPAGH